MTNIQYRVSNVYPAIFTGLLSEVVEMLSNRLESRPRDDMNGSKRRRQIQAPLLMDFGNTPYKAGAL